VPAAAGTAVDLEALAARLAGVARVTANRWMVRAELTDGIRISVFADGRAIVSGTREESRARAIVSRYVGA
jgi:adenylyltransferase/sulfurtransferase